MTAMGTSTRELDIDTLVLTAYQYAGLVNELQTAEGPHWEARSAYGRRQLEIIIDRLAADGIYERSMELYDVTVPAGSTYVEMPADTVDIRGVSAMLDVGGAQVALENISRDEYFALPSPTSTGSIPAQVYLARGSPMRLYLTPVPEGDCVIRVQRQRLSYDNSQGTATPDLERYWTDFIVHELAARLALSAGVAVERVALLQAKAQDAKRAAQGKSSSQLPNRAVLDHRGMWRGRC
jgi:hypothetical protein